MIVVTGGSGNVGSNTVKQLQLEHRSWIASALEQNRECRETFWTEAIAVGSKAYIAKTRELLDERASGRDEYNQQGQYVLREAHTPYSPIFNDEKLPLSRKNIP